MGWILKLSFLETLCRGLDLFIKTCLKLEMQSRNFQACFLLPFLLLLDNNQCPGWVSVLLADWIRANYFLVLIGKSLYVQSDSTCICFTVWEYCAFPLQIWSVCQELSVSSGKINLFADKWVLFLVSYLYFYLFYESIILNCEFFRFSHSWILG